MKIEDRRKKVKENPKAEAGDLILINEDLCLVVNKNDWNFEKCKRELAVVILSGIDGSNWMVMASGYQERFEKGEYKIYAKKGTWGILE